MTSELWTFFGLLFSIIVAFGAIGLMFYVVIRLPFGNEKSRVVSDDSLSEATSQSEVVKARVSETSDDDPRIGPD